MSDSEKDWIPDVISAVSEFAEKYRTVYKKTEREVAAYFEIGCFLALIGFYEKRGFVGTAANLDGGGAYRYLTTPNGNPANFSHMVMQRNEVCVELRQQVRIVSHLHPDISFTPDMVVVRHGTEAKIKTDPDYAGGKRSFFYVESRDVIAAHECKSMVPFPELMVSFIGMLVTAHAWYGQGEWESLVGSTNDHLAPALFVGGSARPLHTRMVKAMKKILPLNIVLGMHSGTWDLLGATSEAVCIRDPLGRLEPPSSDPGGHTAHTVGLERGKGAGDTHA